jgi:ribosomal protein L7/L12
MFKLECDNVDELRNLFDFLNNDKVEKEDMRLHLLKEAALREQAEKEASSLQKQVDVLQVEVNRLNKAIVFPEDKDNFMKSLKELIFAVSAPSDRFRAVKVVREMTGLGLQEAKDLLEDGLQNRV